jgi:hypothetical protein
MASEDVELSAADWAEIDGLVRYPHSVRTTERTARRLRSVPSTLYVHLQSEPYEVGIGYQRFHFVNCSKKDLSWRCDQVMDGMRIREMRWFAVIHSSIPSPEILEIADALSGYLLSLRSVVKSGNDYKISVSEEDRDCFGDFVVRRGDDGKLLPVPRLRDERCY